MKVAKRRYTVSDSRPAGTPRGLAGGGEFEARGEAAKLVPMPELDLMIEMGWGDTPQANLPADWRTRRKISRARSADA